MVSNIFFSNIVDFLYVYQKTWNRKKFTPLTNHNRKPQPQCGAMLHRFVGWPITWFWTSTWPPLVSNPTYEYGQSQTSSAAVQPSSGSSGHHLLLLLYQRSYLKIQQFASLSVIRWWFHRRSINNIPRPCFSLERNFKTEIHKSTFSIKTDG